MRKKTIDKLNLESLCGEHYLSGVEMTERMVHTDYGEDEERNVLLFTLDGTTYMMVENPEDGYRSYCDRIEIVPYKPMYSFPPVRVLCHTKEDDDCEQHNCIVMRDMTNGKIVLEAGTQNYNDYYPMCYFSYTPENMACNQQKGVNNNATD